MQGHEFDDGMKLIRARWGENSYPKQLELRIWHHCKELPYKSFERIIFNLMDLSRTPPMPREWQLQANVERDRLGLKSGQEPTTKIYKLSQCKDCGDSGNLFVVRKEGHDEWARWHKGIMRCHCEVGRRRPPSQGPVWCSSFSKSYEIEKAHSVDERRFTQDEESKARAVLRNINSAQTRENRTSRLERVGKMFSDNDDGPQGAA